MKYTDYKGREIFQVDDKIVCPYCNHEHEANEQEWWSCKDEVDIDIECENCEREFIYWYENVNPNFKSQKKENE